MEEQYKTCPRCYQCKPFSAYYKNRSQKDGLGGWCRDCMKAYQLERYHDDTDTLKDYCRDYRLEKYAENPEYFRARTRQFIADNPEYIKEWKANNRDKTREYSRRYRAKKRAQHIKRAQEEGNA